MKQCNRIQFRNRSSRLIPCVLLALFVCGMDAQAGGADVDNLRVEGKGFFEGEVLMWPHEVGDLDTNGMTLHYAFTIDEGTNITDYSVHERDGTAFADATWITGGKCDGGAYDFDGFADYISTDTNTKMSALITASSGTIAAWIKPIGTPQLFSDPRNGDVVVTDSDKKIGIFHTVKEFVNEDRLWVCDQVCLGVEFDYQVWTHVAWVHTNGVLYAYKDGVEVASTNISDSTGLDEYLIGGGVSGGNNFDGSIDEIIVFNRGLSSNEVYDLYRYCDPTEPYAGEMTVGDIRATSNSTITIRDAVYSKGKVTSSVVLGDISVGTFTNSP